MRHRSFLEMDEAIEKGNPSETAQALAHDVPALLGELEEIALRLASHTNVEQDPAPVVAPATRPAPAATPAARPAPVARPRPNPYRPETPPQKPKDGFEEFMKSIKPWREAAGEIDLKAESNRILSVVARIRRSLAAMGTASAASGGGDDILAALMAGMQGVKDTINRMYRRQTYHNPLKNLRQDLTQALKDANADKKIDVPEVMYNISLVANAVASNSPTGGHRWALFYPGEIGTGTRGVVIDPYDQDAHARLAQEAAKTKRTDWRVALAGGSGKDDSFYFDVSNEASALAAARWLAHKIDDPKVYRRAQQAEKGKRGKRKAYPKGQATSPPPEQAPTEPVSEHARYFLDYLR